MADNTLQGIRQQHPEYSDLSDQQLADGLYKKFYSDMPRDQFNVKIGLSNPAAAATTQPSAPDTQPSLMDEAKRQLGLTARYGVEGLTALPNMVGNAANSTLNLGSALINKVAGTHIPAIQPMSTSVDQALDDAGLPQPQTTVEKIVAEPSKFLASIPSFGIPAAASKIEELAPLAEKYFSQALGASAGGTALGVTKQVAPDNKTAQLAATVAATLAGNRTGEALSGTAEAAPTIASTQQLKNAGSAAYKAADDAGVLIKPAPVEDMANSIKSDLADFGYHPQMQPLIAPILGELDRINGQNITTKQVQIIRRMANNARLSSDPSTRTLGGTIVNKVDDLMQNLQPNDIVQGDAASAAANLQQGAQLWKQYSKSKAIDTASDKADLNAATSGSGGNVANTTRQQIKAILINPKRLAGYTADEIEQMNDIARGGKLTNALRLIGKFSPTTGALPAMAGASAAGSGLTGAMMTGNPLLAMTGLVPLIGYGAKALSDSRTLQGVQDLSELIRSGGTKASLAAAKNPPSAISAGDKLNDNTINYLRLLLQNYSLNNGDTLSSPSSGLLNAPTGIAGQNIQGQRR